METKQITRTIIGHERQRIVSIPKTEWDKFPTNCKVKVISKDNKEFYRYVRLVSKGRQKKLSIPKEEWKDFKIGDKVKICPV